MPRRLAPPSPTLTDEVVRLEPLVERFVPDFDALTRDPDIQRFTRVPTALPDGFAVTWVGRYVTGWEDGSRAGFAVLDSETATFLGMAALVEIRWDESEAELGYMVAPAARGRGVAGRAIRLVSGWALELGLARVEALIDIANEPSLRAVERAGYTREGVLRSTHFKDGERADIAVYSLLPGDPR